MNLADLSLLSFDQPDLWPLLEARDDAGLDGLSFGIIGFDAEGIVRRYNDTECNLAALGRHRVVGLHLFGVVAQCMNNYLVAQRFDDAAASGSALDVTVDYVLTLRMKPTPVKLRLLAGAPGAMRYVCVLR
jgi:photoactive yellow protein